MTDEAEELARHAEELRLGVVRGVHSALLRRGEVFAAIAASETRAQASAAIRGLLQLDEVQAQAVLSLQWADVTRAAVEKIADEIAKAAQRSESSPVEF